jgi:hypothetical protein
MVSEVKVLVAFNRIFLSYTILVLFWACSPKKINRDDPVNQQIDLRYADGEVYNQKREILEKESLRLELEKTWISMRSRVVVAEKELNQALLAKLSIEAGLARFEALSRKFPSEDGMIKEQERLTWQARLQSRENDVIKARAQLNLYQRESNELRFEISRIGFSTDSSPLLR